MRPHVAANLLLLVLFPVAWAAPMARAGVLPWFSGDEISVLGGLGRLWEVDPALAVLVAAFAIVIPWGKCWLLVAAHFGWAGPAAVAAVDAVGKLSMADVFLVAVYIVVVKGVGIGHVTPAWGLWLFTGCVLASIWVGWTTRRTLRNTG